ncbi:hypothetical protein ASPZODRAFT_151787 [Penicilliopsis zonata CBS 506.65]|uniref:Uncharacterized protein n=1 Tax=Penicilliopsis zonata CBS 506.65 TaxID=1073090 RepID=A0A1L9SJ72_9EURO|nr:hypothetical protein ASPZODRAFT_151787 [Penicilliopsis zonata CBS 506.65]OJJ47282.1 hypothetical protein ASPZODRAFT_151787 [Penicilliopsis zonata CBS 506.65]
MSRKVPHAAFCEDFDEDARVSLPETRQVAHHPARLPNKAELRLSAAPGDGSSDSGYSSRTAATVNSTQSAPSGRKSPLSLKLDAALRRTAVGANVNGASRKDRGREKIPRSLREEKMQVGPYPGAGHSGPPGAAAAHHRQRSPSKARRRERENAQVRHFPGQCWECDHGLYHSSTASVDSRSDYPPAAYYTNALQEYGHPPPPSPQSARYPPSVIQDVHVSHSSRPPARTNRSNSYHTNNRPVSFHGAMMPGGMPMPYGLPPPPPPPMTHSRQHYDHGPPLPFASSAYANGPSYPPTYPHQQQLQQLPPPPPPPPPPQGGYYSAQQEYLPPALPDSRNRDRSESRSRDPPPRRRMSVYDRPVVDYDPPTPTEYDEEPPTDRRALREPPRSARMPPPAPMYDQRDEDYYSMPPPPMRNNKAQIIHHQKRPEMPHKSLTSAGPIAADRRPSRAFDMSDMESALSDHSYRRMSREAMLPERSHSVREGHRSTMYHQESRPSRIAIEGARRRRVYYNDPFSSGEGGGSDSVTDEVEEKEREAEAYQKVHSGGSRSSGGGSGGSSKSAPVALTADALRTAKSSSRADSDSASQKSRSNSSRGSDARTRDGSNVGSASKPEEDNNIVMMMNGVTMSFSQESAANKRISVRTGESGQVEFNIGGSQPPPKKYLPPARSEYAGSSSGRRDHDEPRRPMVDDPRRLRDDRRSDRVSRRSSRSVYSSSRAYMD